MRATAAAYLELTKPGITLFIGVTAGAGFVTAAGGWGPSWLLPVTLTATMLMSAGAATLNQVAEAVYDARMRRTASRPLPAGLIPAGRAALFGWGLAVAGFLLALLLLPLLAAVFLALCHVSYVNVYTPLKRRTPYCTLAGAIPGALPVLAGWAAAGAPIDAAALALTGVLFMWQIPHFLAIGWLARDDYRAAGCPVLAVVEATGRASGRVSLVYAAGVVVCAAVLGLTAGTSALFLVAALLTGGAYVVYAWRFVRRPERTAARGLFFSSIIILPVLLGALMADVLLLG